MLLEATATQIHFNLKEMKKATKKQSDKKKETKSTLAVSFPTRWIDFNSQFCLAAFQWLTQIKNLILYGVACSCTDEMKRKSQIKNKINEKNERFHEESIENAIPFLIFSGLYISCAFEYTLFKKMDQIVCWMAQNHCRKKWKFHFFSIQTSFFSILIEF